MKEKFLLAIVVIAMSLITFGSISALADTTINVSSMSELQSVHPYSNNMNTTWVYTYPTAVSSLDITFSSDTETESGYDYIYIYDGNDNLLKKESGTALAGKIITIPGNVVKIKLTSDDSVQKNGFTVTNIKANGSQSFTTIATGTCGGNLTWTLDTYGILTISGYGNMYDWDWYTEKAPWYYLNDKIYEVVIEDGVGSIGNYAFYKCSSLIDVTISNSVSYIGTWTFSNCENLASIIISEGVTRIGMRSFSECTKLTSVTIPSTITSIDSSVFYSCTGLKQVNITNLSAWCNISFANSDSNPLRYANKLYLSGNLVTDLVIPDTVTYISDYAFYCCSSKSLSIPDSVTSIGALAFNYANLTDVKMGKNIKNIGRGAFGQCKFLQSVTLPDGLTTIEDSVFSRCTQLKSITIPNSVTSIGDSAFYACNGLFTVNYIGSPKQWNDIVVGPDNTCLTNALINYIYNQLLDYMTYITTEYGDAKITDCDTGVSGDISIPSTIEGYPVTTIDYNAFKDCDKITSVVFPESVTDIFGSAFENCTALSSITFTDNVKWIGGSAFGNCTSLTSVTLPAGLSDIGDRAFYGCTSLKSIEIDESNNKFSTIDGNLFNKQATTMMQYSVGKTENSYTIPDGVTTIKTYCFEDCVNLTSITIPQSVKTIGLAAFRDCSNIENIYYYGKQDEWSKISIGNYNDGLNKATIHFIYPRTETVLSNNDKTFTITPINIATGNTVILALYNGTALVEMQSAVYNGETILFTTTKDYANAKVFVWENFETLVPICEAEIVK